ncbi:BadF/BadG/BcrA/BcrD ATPase family protein [Paenibacillus lemnae]|uniref:N-acetylglucosamine kinase n=1 Tax=Paenibacillus lemnae TaxID=1330551 RepID=A0A848M9M4_PAELE|nr:BadF/BadG/BcrA/BcrD ATPase family protein [Paenibacillus lemnae]NMO97938.1 N-acetylglucosamine kinase [Paenibacillus lemnae]
MNIYIGMDGGGTKTEMVAVDEHGEVVSRYAGKSTNPYVVTFQGAMEELARVLDELLPPLQVTDLLCKGACFGMSGISSEAEQQQVQDFMREYQQQRNLSFPLTLTTEAEISLMAALEQDYGVLVISGTGSNTYGITNSGQRFRAGGWGHILGDEGSGYQIGLLTLKSIIKSHEGILPPTIMTERIKEHYHFQSMLDLKAYIYQPSIQKSDVASFARFCIEAARDGDETAIAIIMQQAAEIADTAAALITRHPELSQTDVVCTGSVFKYSELFNETFKHLLLERYPQITFPKALNDYTAGHGAALLARKMYR